MLVGVAALALVSGLTLTMADAATGAGWSITPTPQTSNRQGLNDVSCPSATSCFAVGGSDGKALIQKWSVDHWNVMAGATLPANTTYSSLYAVDCPSADSCFAVGTDNSRKTFILKWSVDHWNVVVRSPIRQGTTSVNLFGISCPGTNSCFAVGADDPPRYGTLILHWNGHDWAVQSSPNPGPGTRLYAVSCPGRWHCYAVGRYGSPSARTLAVHWNGLQWTTKASPNHAGSRLSYLTGVSCPSLQSCFAVGTTELSELGATVYGTLIERWNGTSWNIMNAPSPRQGMILNAVSCPSPDSCFAVGADEGSGGTLVERWIRGAPWFRMASPSPDGAPSLRGVTCRDTDNCFAVGNTVIDFTNGPVWTLIERYRG